MSKLNGVMILPTGLGCSIGGDAGFNSGCKLIAECSENLVVNPNLVNASDLNEMPNNCLYIEGSAIDRFLSGKLNLQKIKTFNKILMAVNSPVLPVNYNSQNAGIWGLGADIEIIQLNTPLLMKAEINTDGTAGGIYSGVEELVEQLIDKEYDALALHTPIECASELSEYYWKNGGVNPWGGAEAITSHAIAELINKPVAHAPYSTDAEELHVLKTTVVKQSMAPEIISNTYLFSVLKGLHRAPRIVLDTNKMHPDILSRDDIAFLLTPHGCWRRPHQSCLENNIPIIVVRENTTCFSKDFQYLNEKGIIFVENYLEASGVIMAMTAGVDYRTVTLKGKK